MTRKVKRVLKEVECPATDENGERQARGMEGLRRVVVREGKEPLEVLKEGGRLWSYKYPNGPTWLGKSFPQ